MFIIPYKKISWNPLEISIKIIFYNVYVIGCHRGYNITSTNGANDDDDIIYVVAYNTSV